MSKEKKVETNEVDFSTVTEESVEESTEQQPSAEENQFQEVVEVSWEEIEQVSNLKQAVAETEQYVSNFLLDVEKRKGMLLNRLGEMENALYQQAQAIKQSKNLNPEWTFELKLPEKQGDKAYFIRKHEQ